MGVVTGFRVYILVFIRKYFLDVFRVWRVVVRVGVIFDFSGFCG